MWTQCQKDPTGTHRRWWHLLVSLVPKGELMALPPFTCLPLRWAPGGSGPKAAPLETRPQHQDPNQDRQPSPWGGAACGLFLGVPFRGHDLSIGQNVQQERLPRPCHSRRLLRSSGKSVPCNCRPTRVLQRTVLTVHQVTAVLGGQRVTGRGPAFQRPEKCHR